MPEETLHKIIRSFEQQDRLSAGTNSPADTGSINVSLADLQILAESFITVFPERLQAFATKLSEALTELDNQNILSNDNSSRKAAISELLEENKELIICLNQLNRIIIARDFDQSSAGLLTRFFNIGPFREPVSGHRDQYLEKLAETYVRGHHSDTVQYLIETGNIIFQEHAGFTSDIKTSITITERARLKKNMELLDEEDMPDLTDMEMKAAVTQLERERLKQAMNEWDAETGQRAMHVSTDGPDGLEKARHAGKVIPLDKNRSNWRRYAVAAGVIGLIALGSVILYNYNQNTPPGIAGNPENPADTNRVIPGKNAEIAASLFDSVQMSLPVNKEERMGFAMKQERITLHIYRFKESPDKLPDSLKRLDRNYLFKDSVVTLYLAGQDIPVFYYLDDNYYLGLHGTIFQVRRSDKLRSLNRVADKTIIDRIDKINFRQE